MAAVSSIGTTTNQKLAEGIGGIIEGRRAERQARERALVYRLGVVNKVTKRIKQKKYVVALDGRQPAKQHTTINQKQRPRWGVLLRGGVTSGRRGGARYHCILEGGSQIRRKNLK